MTYDPNERKQLEAAIAERAAYIERLKREETSSRDDTRYYDRTPDPEPVVTKSARQPMSHDMSDAWQSYIARAIDEAREATVRLCMEVTGEVLGKERKRAAEEHAKMRSEFKAALEVEVLKLRNEWLEQERGLPKRLRVVPPDAQGGMIA
jgi:hypothetical protein